jgi:hypothetical protein
VQVDVIGKLLSVTWVCYVILGNCVPSEKRNQRLNECGNETATVYVCEYVCVDV